jgi:hypothetical protein
MYFIGLDVHKKTISYCVKDAAGHVHQEGKIGSTRRELDGWIRNLPQPRTIAMEATIFTGWIYEGLAGFVFPIGPNGESPNMRLSGSCGLRRPIR